MHIRDLMDNVSVSTVLQKLTVEHGQFFPAEKGEPRVAGVSNMPRRHCDIVRTALDFHGSTIRIFIKIHRRPKRKPDMPIELVRQNAQLEFDTLSHLYDKFRFTPRCAVVRPIAFFPEEMAVVTEEGAGDNLHRLIKHKAGVWYAKSEVEDLQAYCRESGVWLRHFQEFTAQPRQAAFPLEEIATQVQADLDICVHMGLSRSAASSLVRLCETQLSRLEGQDFPVVGEHPDFQPDNILVSPAGVTVLDFTNFRYGSMYSDVARFLVCLDFLLKNPLYSKTTIQTLMQAFLQGYGWKQSASAPGLLVSLIRHLVWTARTVHAWPLSRPMKCLMEWQTARFLSAWCQKITHGDSPVFAGRLPH